MSSTAACGPWSPWQRMALDQELVHSKRRGWIPIFKWTRQVARNHRRRGGVVLMENPWQSEAWYCAEIQSIIHDYGMETHYVDMCSFGLKDHDSGVPHLKPTCLLTDSPGIWRGAHWPCLQPRSRPSALRGIQLLDGISLHSGWTVHSPLQPGYSPWSSARSFLYDELCLCRGGRARDSRGDGF